MVEATAQLQALKFGSSGQGPAAPMSPEEPQEAKQVEQAPLAEEQPPAPAPTPKRGLCHQP